MILEDDRTLEQKKTHTFLIIGTDSFLSGWGEADKGKSFAAWACTPEDEETVKRWVKNRSEMKRVRVVHDIKGNYHPRTPGHCHIYVVTEGHPSLR